MNRKEKNLRRGIIVMSSFLGFAASEFWIFMGVRFLPIFIEEYSLRFFTRSFLALGIAGGAILFPVFGFMAGKFLAEDGDNGK